jgi:hypothetical protein
MLSVELILHRTVIQVLDLNGAVKTAITKHSSAIMVQ